VVRRHWRRRRRLSTAVGLLLLAALLLFQLWSRWSNRAGPVRFEAGGSHVVERVVDGDTLLLEDRTRVRLLGIDTPETRRPDLPVDPLGLDAARFVQQRVEGRSVRLEFDRERRDRFGRVLAYVYAGDLLLNEELIRAGFSRAETHFPYSEQMKRRFRAAEAEAREAGRGGWGDGHW
jgi:micrococcal nuclease